MEKNKKVRKALAPKKMIGWREIVSLPELNLNNFSAKTDTGARTTALHASNIRGIDIAGEKWVEFIPDHDESEPDSVCRVRVLHKRCITNTSGIPEDRFIIATILRIGDQAAYRSLSNRSV